MAYPLLDGGQERSGLCPGDEVVASIVEPRYAVVARRCISDRRAVLSEVVSMEQADSLDLEEPERAITGRTKRVACAHVSRVLGEIVRHGLSWKCDLRALSTCDTITSGGEERLQSHP